MVSNIANTNIVIYAQLNEFKYRYVTLTIPLRYTVKEFQELYFNTNHFIQYYSFVCTQLNCCKYCYESLTIHLNINHLFIHSYMIKQFYF